MKHKITGKERSTPTYLRWSIRELFTTESLKDNPDIAVVSKDKNFKKRRKVNNRVYAYLTFPRTCDRNS